MQYKQLKKFRREEKWEGVKTGIFWVLLESYHHPGLPEVQHDGLPEDHEEVWQEPLLWQWG